MPKGKNNYSNKTLFSKNCYKSRVFKTLTIISDTNNITDDSLCVLRTNEGKRNIMSKPMKLRDVSVGVPCMEVSSGKRVYHPFDVLHSLEFGFIQLKGKNISDF